MVHLGRRLCSIAGACEASIQYIGTIMVITPPNRARPEKKGEAQLDDPRKEVDYKSYYQGKGNDFLIHNLMTAT